MIKTEQLQLTSTCSPRYDTYRFENFIPNDRLKHKNKMKETDEVEQEEKEEEGRRRRKEEEKKKKEEEEKKKKQPSTWTPRSLVTHRRLWSLIRGASHH